MNDARRSGETRGVIKDREPNGKILGRTYTAKREEFEIEEDANTSSGEHA